jgi:hypothetical protein
MKLKELMTGFREKSVVQTVHSCCGEHGHSHQHGHANGPASETIYQCPMKCEGDKTYDAPGRCPVCGMYLQPVTIS